MRDAQRALRQLHRTTLASQNFTKAKNAIVKSLYDPLLQNVLHDVNHASTKESLLSVIGSALKYCRTSQQTIVALVQRKIAKGSTVLCFAPDDLLRQSLATAREQTGFMLLSLKGASHSMPGSSEHPFWEARHIIKKADVVLLSGRIVTPKGIQAPIGSELISILAHHCGIPVYVVCPALSYGPPYKQPTGHPAFEIIHPQLVTGILSEQGIFPYKQHVAEVLAIAPWTA